MESLGTAIKVLFFCAILAGAAVLLLPFLPTVSDPVFATGWSPTEFTRGAFLGGLSSLLLYLVALTVVFGATKA